MRIVRRSDYKRMAWKNGQGLTEEVAAFPPGSDVDSFEWRLSIAHVEADGAFSEFAGIDRTIALLDGPGLALDLPDGSTVKLFPGGAPFPFPGEWKISSRNAGGATIDLNIMTRRGVCAHRMERRSLPMGAVFAATGSGWVVFNTPAQIEAGGEPLTIDRFDALSLENGEEFTSRTDPMEFLFVRLKTPPGCPAV